MANETVLITGNTYPVREQIKALGARWDASAKGWRVPAEKADAARKLVGSVPMQAHPTTHRSRTDSDGYALRRGARACKTGGNCSSFGSGRSCGGQDCDGY